MTPARGGVRLAVAAGTLAAIVLAAACGSGAPRDPFDSVAPPGVREASGDGIYRIRLVVSCDTCSIRWDAGPYGTQVTDRGLWSRNVSVHAGPDRPTWARLSAAPAPGTAAVRYVEISVNGEVVARAEADPSTPREAWATLQVETPIPPRGSGRVIVTDAEGPGS